MAEVTGYTSTRMKQIEDETVTTGSISGDDLILTTRAGSNINAGNVRGPQGIQGPTGEVTTAAMNAAIAAATESGAIGTSDLADDAVTNAKLADNAVGVENIQLGAVQTGEIANGAVTTDKIGSSAVTTDKILGLAVTGGKIAPGTITSDKYADGSVTVEALASDIMQTETLPAINGWGGIIYYIAWQNIVFVTYSNFAVGGATSDVIATMPFGFRPIRNGSMACQTNNNAVLSINTSGDLSIPRTSLSWIVISSFFEK